MSDAVRKLLPALAVLTDAEKAELRGLLSTNDEPEPTPDDWEAAWDEECARRIAAMDRGEMETYSAEEVFNYLRERRK